MIKKALLLLLLPYSVFIYLESCNKPCEHPETRNITGITMQSDTYYSINRTTLRMTLNYESLYVQNFQFNLTNKAMALSQVYDPCFNKLVNPIDSISVVSAQDFNSSFASNTELNSLFSVLNQSSMILLKDYSYDINIDNTNYYDDDFYVNSISFINDSIPTIDSVHDLSIKIYCRTGEIFEDSLIGVNLKSNL